MKKLFLILLTISFVAFVGIAEAKYDSTINPEEFGDWQVLGVVQGRIGSIVAMENPDENAEIRFAYALVAFDSTLLTYAYMENSELKYYALNPITEDYGAFKLPERLRQSLIKSLLELAKTGETRKEAI